MRQKRLKILFAFLALLAIKTGLSGEDVQGQKNESESNRENDSPSDVLAGHSYHGEAFNEGPRQKAYLMSGTGRVSFPVTTSDELAQKFINQGVGQLYGFWYFEAERSFRQAAAIDPDCAMAYWGAALANGGNEKRSKGFIEEAVKRKGNATDRERMYIDAWAAYIKAGKSKKKQRSQAYTKALEDLLAKYPRDLEAKAFLALQNYRNKSAGIPISSYFAVDALIQQILRVEPLHPSHHFRIHLWDRRRPQEALSSAAMCGQGSPSIAHMWHMPGHIYSRLKRYHDAVWQQEASARVDHAHMMRDRVMPDQIHNYAHNNEWLIRNLIHIGRVHDAVDLAKNMIELPRHPKYNTLSKKGSTYYGRLRLFEVLSKFELWEEMIRLCNSPYLEPTDRDSDQAKRVHNLGWAYFGKSDIERGDEQLKQLQQRLKTVKVKQTEAVAEAEKKAKNDGKNQKQIDAAKSAASKKFDSQVHSLQRPVDALLGHRDIANGGYESGLKLLQKAGGVDRLYLARVRLLAGKSDQAIREIQSQIKTRKNEVLPLASLVEAQWKANQKADAEKTFKQLRRIASATDIDTPACARLAPIAKELNLPENWRIVQRPSKDVGERPKLDSLGPFRWRPSAAPNWTLIGDKDVRISLKQFQGKPLLLIFFLGHGCLHCAEQLQAFGPAADDFEAAGIAMVAISTDNEEDLKRSIEKYEGGSIPIPLVSNSEMDVFKAYRAYDDFEDQPLHATFLIDENGMILWQDISYEPFMGHRFVLQEAKRLLGQKRTKTEDSSSDSLSVVGQLSPG